MKFDGDLCLNLFKHWQQELNPRVRCAIGNVLSLCTSCGFLLDLSFVSLVFVLCCVSHLADISSPVWSCFYAQVVDFFA